MLIVSTPDGGRRVLEAGVFPLHPLRPIAEGHDYGLTYRVCERGSLEVGVATLRPTSAEGVQDTAWDRDLGVDEVRWGLTFAPGSWSRVHRV
jgi:hypothetical protein